LVELEVCNRGPRKRASFLSTTSVNVKEDYLACLKQHSNNAEKCQEVAKLYLECRMDRNLMAKQDLKHLGFREQPPISKGGS